MTAMTNNLRIARMSRGLTQAELARQTGVSRATINNIERGHVKRPSDETMIAIAKCLGCAVEEIFFTPLVQHVQQRPQSKSA